MFTGVSESEAWLGFVFVEKRVRILYILVAGFEDAMMREGECYA